VDVELEPEELVARLSVMSAREIHTRAIPVVERERRFRRLEKCAGPPCGIQLAFGEQKSSFDRHIMSREHGCEGGDLLVQKHCRLV
jgi:hypothetical protein